MFCVFRHSVSWLSAGSSVVRVLRMFNFGEMGVRFKLELAVTGALFKAKDFLVDFGLGHVIKLDLLRQNIGTEF